MSDQLLDYIERRNAAQDTQTALDMLDFFIRDVAEASVYVNDAREALNILRDLNPQRIGA